MVSLRIFVISMLIVSVSPVQRAADKPERSAFLLTSVTYFERDEEKILIISLLGTLRFTSSLERG